MANPTGGKKETKKHKEQIPLDAKELDLELLDPNEEKHGVLFCYTYFPLP